MKLKYLAVAVSLVCFTSSAFAVPFTFTPGQPARAADVNQNFETLEAQIEANTNNITANSTAININSAAISTNAAAIGNNTASINTNAANIFANAALIGANTTAISDSAADIAANTASIGINATDILSNVAAISSNANGIAANAAGIAANAAAIAAIPVAATYDYRDYAAVGSISSKTFTVTGIGTCDTEVRNFTRSTVGDTTTITRTRVRTGTGGPCGYVVHTMQATPSGYYIVSEESYNSDGTVPGQTVTLDNPVLMRSTSMSTAMPMIDTTTTTVIGGSTPVGTFIEKTTVAGIENVTVPYNGGTTFNGCLKLHMQRSSSVGFFTFERVSWFCADVGFVKGIQSNGATWVLTDITYTP